MHLKDKLKTRKVLLIDDDESIRKSLGYFFRKKVLSFMALENAESAIEQLKNDSFDIIICDYKLPGMNGLEFLKLLKREYPDTMKVLITAYASHEVVTEAIQIGIHDFIQKPFTAKTLEASLAGLIEKKEYHEPLIDGQKLNE